MDALLGEQTREHSDLDVWAPAAQRRVSAVNGSARPLASAITVSRNASSAIPAGWFTLLRSAICSSPRIARSPCPSSCTVPIPPSSGRTGVVSACCG
ncbi:hypothetical protein OHB41_09490 [Streptomyces sp. NBC_01571]|uniref:hypothetical protein n=1 Tax=Streptomyces sp. NBC_01571 TaxID=2975883 RepID=UPI00224FF485|nr:hypothetical protein [Streptomyces sp. NBC_01571]MCX4573411.1 hypothetical protein [Streptomyces sp. NBC_01571]